MDDYKVYAIDWSHTDEKCRCYDGKKITKTLPEPASNLVLVTENMPAKQMKPFSDAGSKIYRCSTHQTKKFRQIMGLEKTDDNDVRIIFGLWEKRPEEFYEYYYNPVYYEFKTLYSAFKRIQKVRNAIGNQSWAAPDSLVLQKHKGSLEDQEAEVVRDIGKMLSQMPIYTEYLSKVAGVDVKTAAGLIAHVGDIRRFQNISCYMAYFGLHTVDGKAPRKSKGKMANWDQDGRALILGVIGDIFVKLKEGQYVRKDGKVVKRKGSPYRDIYDKARLHYDPISERPIIAHRCAIRKACIVFMKKLWKAYHRLVNNESVSDLIEFK